MQTMASTSAISLLTSQATLAKTLQTATEEIAEHLCVRVTVKLLPLRFLRKIASRLGVPPVERALVEREKEGGRERESHYRFTT